MPDSSGLLAGTGAKLEHGFRPPFNRVRKSAKQGQKSGAFAVIVFRVLRQAACPWFVQLGKIQCPWPLALVRSSTLGRWRRDVTRWSYRGLGTSPIESLSHSAQERRLCTQAADGLARDARRDAELDARRHRERLAVRPVTWIACVGLTLPQVKQHVGCACNDRSTWAVEWPSSDTRQGPEQVRRG